MGILTIKNWLKKKDREFKIFNGLVFKVDEDVMTNDGLGKICDFNKDEVHIKLYNRRCTLIDSIDQIRKIKN